MNGHRVFVNNYVYAGKDSTSGGGKGNIIRLSFWDNAKQYGGDMVKRF